MGLSVDALEPPLDDIAFLARSNNRISVLEALEAGPRTRRELREATDVSRPTLGRVLEGFAERGWVREAGGEYELTPVGRIVADEFASLMVTVERTQELREVADRLPLEEMDFDPRLLVEATVTTPSPTDATAHSRREAELLARTDRLQFLCNQAQPETVERYRDWVVEGEGTFEAVIAGDAVDAATAHEEMGEYLRDLVASDRSEVYRYDGTVSVMLGLFDDTASIVPLDDVGVPCAFIESEHEAVRAWVRDTLETYRERADLVTPASLAQ